MKTPYKLACPHIAAWPDGDAASVERNVAAAIRSVELCVTGDKSVALILLPLGFASGGSGLGELEPDGKLLAPLADAAVRHDLYIAGADIFSGAPVAFVIDPKGALALMQSSIGHGVGVGTFAVLDTPLGKIACLPGDDLLHPEYTRAAVLAGAEILLNPYQSRRDERSEGAMCSRGARAWENLAYVAVSAPTVMHGPATDGVVSQRGEAQVWLHTGLSVAKADGETLLAVIDLEALRARRRDPFLNFIAQLRTDLYAKAFETYAPPPAPEPEGPVYDALVMQTHEIFIDPGDDREALINQNIDNALSMAAGFAMRPGTRLVVFPEFFMHGTGGRTLADHCNVALRLGGPETERIANFARQSNCFVCASFFEVDADWPGRFFNTSVIFDPRGEPILRYRKLQCADLAGMLPVTTPGNVFDQYVERYGFDGVFPVVQTEIGTLATMICFDSNWPELWRALALRGAEVICHPTSEINSERRTPWTLAKRAHAFEQMVYVAAANVGSEQFRPGGPVTHMNSGQSCVIDYNGMFASRAAGGGVVPQVGRIDIGALRRARRLRYDGLARPFRPEAVAKAYEAFGGFPLNCFADAPMEQPQEGLDLVRRQVEALSERGVLPKPLASELEMAR